MYYVQLNLNISDLNIQLEELSEVKWFNINSLIEMVKNGELNQGQVDFFYKCTEFLNNKGTVSI